MSSTTKLKARSSKTSKRTFTKQELLRHLQILGPVTNPLPATLPPSPPASRSASPVPQQSSSKRKREEDSNSISQNASSSDELLSNTTSKRSRTSPDVSATTAPPALLPGASTLAPDDQQQMPAFPIRRPRRGGRSSRNSATIQAKYMEQGRMFKRSAEARLNAYLRPESPMFAVLKNRPPIDSPYAKYDRMISRFEALDSLLTFAYAQFYVDLANNQNNLHWWQNSAPYFETLTKRHMEGFTNPGPAEEALHGIHFMVDAYWRARLAWHHLRYNVENRVGHLLAEHHKSPLANKASPAVSEASGSGRSSSVNLGNTTLQPTPPSTGHSPAGVQASNGPSNGHSSASRSPPGPPGIPFPEELAKLVLTSTKLFTGSSTAFVYASQKITLPILEQHFPRTFARVTKSTLKYNDEFEIDFEDDESELFWPMAPSRGEGLGWVLALGRSMLREYAKKYGYKGIDGVVRPEEITYPNKH